MSKKRKQRKRRPPASSSAPPPSRPPRWLVPVAVIVLVGLSATLLIRGRQTDSEPASHPDTEQAGTVTAPQQGASSADGVVDKVVRIEIDHRDRPVSPTDRVTGKVDPSADDWNTEVLNDAASGQLKLLAKRLTQSDDVAPADVAGLADAGFLCPSLVPDRLEIVFDDGTLSVRRPTDQVLPTTGQHRGAPGLAEALRRLRTASGEGREVRAKFKLFSIESSQEHFTTRQFLETNTRGDDRGTQINATWLCRWSYPGDGTSAEPRLLSIGLEAYELVEVRAAGGCLFADCTVSALGRNDSYGNQVLPGIDHWVSRISRINQMSIEGHQGVSVGDVNGDGLDDLYVCGAGGLPNRLYVQNPDGTATDVSAAAGVDWLDDTRSALLVDLDNDGDQDLAIALSDTVLLAENNGRGAFAVRGQMQVVANSSSMCVADYDSDGDLDLYVCGYATDMTRGALPSPVPYHDANNGGSNVLLRNEGNFEFVDVTDAVGLNANNTRFSFAAAWEDYDNDGDMDLAVANDFGRNNLYRNDPQGGGNGADRRFTDVAAQAGVEDVASGMSVAWGDYNRDGWMDLYISNMFSAAGNRIAYQRRVADDVTPQVAVDIQRMARGNTLFAATGAVNPDRSKGFSDVSNSAGVTMGRWAWASKFADLNNDGWPDLAVANGNITTDQTGDL